MPRKRLTDATLRSLKAAPKGGRYDVMDEMEPGLGVRVNDEGQRTFIYVSRFPGSSNPTRRSLGKYDAMSLEEAREKARTWRKLIAKGIDPRDEEDEARAVRQRRRDTTFGGVVEDYIRLAAVGPDEAKPLQRKGPVVARRLRSEFVQDRLLGGGKVRRGLGSRPIDSITPHDIVQVIDDAVERGAVYQAHNLLGDVRTFFNWAIARGVYGIERSPTDRMRPEKVIGARKALRTRVLNDAELFAVWRAAAKLGYPFRDFVRLLILTGQRRSEVAEMRWREVDLDRRLWIIPAERMKADAPHVVPLSDDAVAILKNLPRFKRGDYVFTTTHGVRPISGFSKCKARLDRFALRALKARARVQSGNPALVELPDYVLHDLRRTMRTALSGIRGVSSDVAELVIAHARPGLRRVYDQHAFLDEKREALDLWAARLREIVANPSPPPAALAPGKVVSLAARRRRR